MIVFVVMKGENGEGGSIQGVYDNLQAATDKVDQLIVQDTSCKWRMISYRAWASDGCDWITVEIHEVRISV
jgi:hypothetical protein